MTEIQTLKLIFCNAKKHTHTIRCGSTLISWWFIKNTKMNVLN